MSSRRIAVLFGSETGTAQEVAERIAHDIVLLTKSGSSVVNPATVTTTVQLAPMDAVPIASWRTAFDFVIFVVATAGNGDPPRTMRSSWAQLLQRSMPRFDIAAADDDDDDGDAAGAAKSSDDVPCLRFAVFGLGDSTYPRFNFMAKMLHNRLERLGGVPLVHRALGDDEDPQGYETELRPFLDSLYDKLSLVPSPPRDHDETEDAAAPANPTPLPAALFPIADKYEPLWNLEIVSFSAVDVDAHIASTSPLLRRFTVQQNQRVTSLDHFQDVRHIRLVQEAAQKSDLLDQDSPSALSSSASASESTPAFLPGDTFVLLPRAPALAVDATLAMLRLKADDVVRMVPNPKCDQHIIGSSSSSSISEAGSEQQQQQQQHLLFPYVGVPFRAADLFARVLDVQASVPRQLLWVMAGWCRGAKLRAAGIKPQLDEEDEVMERLEQLSRLSMDDFMEYVTRERRPVYEMLQDFWPMLLDTGSSTTEDPTTAALDILTSRTHTKFVPANWRSVIVSHFRPTAPRHFSIAKFAGVGTEAATAAIELLVAIHKVTTPMKRKRTGLCSGYLEEMPAAVLGYVERGVHTLPAAHSASSPMLLIGPGTGIAPIRAVVQRRMHDDQMLSLQRPQAEDDSTDGSSCTLVFTGHRHPEKDFVFADEWRQIAAASSHKIAFVHAFSRFDDKKRAAAVAPAPAPAPAPASVADALDRDSSPAPASSTSSAAINSYSSEFKYVQHAISSQRFMSRIASWLQRDDCIVIVSGNAKQMPKDVLDAFCLCLENDDEFAKQALEISDDVESVARKHLEKMRQSGRYVVDAWA